jgi:hypothetical protein
MSELQVQVQLAVMQRNAALDQLLATAAKLEIALQQWNDPEALKTRLSELEAKPELKAV